VLDSLNQAASTRSPSAQDVLAHASTTIAPPEQVASQRTPNAPSELVAPERTTSAPPEQVAPQRTTNAPSELVAPQRTNSAPSELVAPLRTTSAPFELVAPKRTTSAPSEQAALERAMSSPAGNDATDIVAIDVDGDDSPLSSASPEVVRLPLWDDLGRSYNLNCNLLHKFIPNFGLKGTGTKPRSSSSSRVMLPCLSSAALQDDSYQPGRAYHSTHEKVTVTTYRCHQAMSQVAQMRITSAPRDDDHLTKMLSLSTVMTQRYA
jgi:hypothetical protein